MEPCFDHEKLDVYQIELRFLAWVTPLLQELSQVEGIKTREVSDHLERASLSVLLNTAEGKRDSVKYESGSSMTHVARPPSALPVWMQPSLREL
jgi:hypothetical protein